MFVKPWSRKALLSSISILALPVVAAGAPGAAFAADAANDSASVSELVVTATRRDTTIQETPVNIAAVGSEQIKQQGFTNLGELTRFVPGVFVVDHGARSGNTIVVRGLNATSLGSGDGTDDGGGTVATYLGDIPMYVDLKLNDMERVEFLLGPQGTLYGAGTLGGAIRYIPKRPKFGVMEGEVRGDAYSYSHGSSVSSNLGFTLNLPVSDTFALRGSVDYLNDKGFIDQPYVVQDVGVSDPDPNFKDPAAVKANLVNKSDVNTEKTLSARIAARWAPTDALDVNLTYYYQDAKAGGRQASGYGLNTFPVHIDKWESVKRVLEPNQRTNQLLSLEASYDLGFAQLTSATGVSQYKQIGHRDQTDLLISLQYSYEAFPSFTAYTEEQNKTENFTQELRLVSKGDSALSWIVGGYYNRQTVHSFSKEYTPHYDQYLIDIGLGTQLRPDQVEYYSPFSSKLTEAAGFGELTWQMTPKFQITGGARYYTYDYNTLSGVDIPLWSTVVGGRTPVDAFVTNDKPGSQKDNGWLFKFNTSYKFTDDIMTYLTVSEGYRIGSSNGVALCPDPLPGSQIVCAQSNELQYSPDKTVNYEIGVHSQWFNKRLTVNGAVYYIQWKSPQVESATKIGLQPITINGGDAESKGVEINFDAQVTDALSLRGSWAHNKTEFVEATPNLIAYVTAPGYKTKYLTGESGDRLPGSPEDQGSFYARYEVPLADKTLAFAYGFTGATDILTRTGAKGGGYTLPAYILHNASVELKGDDWKTTFYVDNLFDAFVRTSANNTSAYNQIFKDDTGASVYARNFYYNVLPPRKFGVRFEKQF
jgi:iron complex outermembrane receptor protein